MVKLLSNVYLFKIISASLFIVLVTGTNFWSDIEASDAIYFQEPEPVKIDFKEIQIRGTLRMITQYGPTSYFLHGGVDRGFEYELVSRFADENGLKVEVVLIGPDEDPLQILERGEGDLIADHFTIKNELKGRVSYSEPYNYIYDVYDIGETGSENLSVIKYPYENIIGSKSDQYQTTVRCIGEKTPGITVTKSTRNAWVLRKNTPELRQKMDEFIGKHIQERESDGCIKRSAYLNNLRHRYFERDRFVSRYHDQAYDALYSGYLSPYDDIVKSIAAEEGVDWKLVIAVMAQESAFNPEAESLAGALGLMQIIPRFSRVSEISELYEPEINIREGVRRLKKHLTHEAHLNSLNRYSMALAAYNVGMGNLADAKKLALRMGNNPDEWPNIADALLKLMHPEYYQHARYGYKKGTETVNYVEDVLNRYSRYQAIYEMAAHFEKDINQKMMVLN